MQEAEKIHFKVTDRMQRSINEIVRKSLSYRSKKDFSNKALINHLPKVMEMLSGYRDLSSFVKYLNEDITWINIQNPEVNVNTKLISDKALTSQILTETNQKTYSMLCKCSDISSIGKSDIARICLVKELYKVGDEYLNKSKYRRISDKWRLIEIKLKKSNMILIEKLKFDLDREIIQSKMSMKNRDYSLHDISYHYEDFKDSTGYYAMEDTESGKEVISVLEMIHSEINR